MRLTARDQEAFMHLIGLLLEGGIHGTPMGANELEVPGDATIDDEELRAEIARVLAPGSAMFASGVPEGGSDTALLSASDAAGVMGEPAQTRATSPGTESDMERPPRSGPGSSAGEQRRYAEQQLGIDVPPDTSRDEIIALIDEHLAAREAPDGR